MRNKKPSLKQQLKAWSLAVRQRDGFKCQICGQTEYLNAHHIIDKRYKETRLDIRNGISLCPRHHKFNTLHSAHSNGVWFTEWLKTSKPDQYRWILEKSLALESGVG